MATILKYFGAFAKNASAIKKMQDDGRVRLEMFDRLKKIRRLLGQDDKRNKEYYTSLPQDLTSLEKTVPKSQIEEWLEDSERRMECKGAIHHMIQDIEAADPFTVSQQLLDDWIGRIEQSHRLQTCQTAPSDRHRLFSKSYKTWKERATIMFFFLHEYLGGKDAALSSKAFGTPRSTISTWFTDKRYWGKWLPFLEELTVRDVVNSIPHEEVRRMYEDGIEEIEQHGKLFLEKFRNWKPAKQNLVARKSRNGTASTQKQVAIAKKNHQNSIL
jgi:hypothetical protein